MFGMFDDIFNCLSFVFFLCGFNLNTYLQNITTSCLLYQSNIFCHQLIQHMTIDFVRFMKLYTNCSIIQNLQNLCFEFQHNLCKSSLIWQNQSLYFGLIGEKICWSVKEQPVQYEVYQYVMSWLDLKTLKNHK